MEEKASRNDAIGEGGLIATKQVTALLIFFGIHKSRKDIMLCNSPFFKKVPKTIIIDGSQESNVIVLCDVVTASQIMPTTTVLPQFTLILRTYL